MDGTIINTEDLYTECSSELLAKYGKGPLTWDVKINLQGRPAPESNRIMIETYELPLTVEEYTAQLKEIQVGMWARSAYLPGSLELIQYLHQQKIPIAIGTSSNRPNYDLKTVHLPGFDLFGPHVITGDDPRVVNGKPAPDIWYACLKSINDERATKGLEPIDMSECLIFEDGLIGVESAIKTEAKVVWIPHPESLPCFKGKEREIVGPNNEVLGSLVEFDKPKYGL